MKTHKVSFIHLSIGIGSPVTRHVVAMKKAAEQHILIKCCKCNIFKLQVI